MSYPPARMRSIRPARMGVNCLLPTAYCLLSCCLLLQSDRFDPHGWVVAPLFDDRNRTAGTGAGDEPVPPMLNHRARPPLARIMTIDRALRAGAWPNTRTLADEIKIDRWTIRHDIDYMRDQLNAAN
jgi:hypothetical protein